MKRYLAILLFALLGGCASLPAPAPSGGILEVVPLQGAIDDETVATMHATVDRINSDSEIKTVLLMVNSPGGGVYASGALYDELSRINVPVVAYCEAMCASGAVYAIMAPSVKAIALGQQSLIGSVGVIRAVQREQLPPNVTIIKSGKFKQAGATTEVVPGEDEYLRRQIDEAASIFYSVVEKARGKKINADGWEHIKNAEIFFGKYGVAVGLADVVTSRTDVLRFAMIFAHADLTPRFAQ